MCREGKGEPRIRELKKFLAQYWYMDLRDWWWMMEGRFKYNRKSEKTRRAK